MPRQHLEKGSAAAKAWARKMQRARQIKKAQIRAAGRKTEQEFFTPSGKLRRNAPSTGFHWVKVVNRAGETLNILGPYPSKEYADKVAIREREMGFFTYSYKMNPGENPGALWHQEAATVAGRFRRSGHNAEEKALYAGMETAHLDSAKAAKKMGMNPKKRMKKNPIAIYNPPAQVAGTIYENAIEIRAEKKGGPLKGRYKHIFGSNKVKILGLKDGTVLLQHKEGKPLWMSREDYERSGRKH